MRNNFAYFAAMNYRRPTKAKKAAREKWSRNAVAAKARKRIERGETADARLLAEVAP